MHWPNSATFAENGDYSRRNSRLAENGDYSRRQSPNKATIVAENGDNLSPNLATVAENDVSPKTATVAEYSRQCGQGLICRRTCDQHNKRDDASVRRVAALNKFTTSRSNGIWIIMNRPISCLAYIAIGMNVCIASRLPVHCDRQCA